MAKKGTQIMIPDEVIMSKIYLIRGQKVMLDRDLAILYEVETKRLKEEYYYLLEKIEEQYNSDKSEIFKEFLSKTKDK